MSNRPSRIQYSSAETTHIELALQKLKDDLVALEQDPMLDFAITNVAVALEALQLRKRFRARHESTE